MAIAEKILYGREPTEVDILRTELALLRARVDRIDGAAIAAAERLVAALKVEGDLYRERMGAALDLLSALKKGGG